MAIIDSLNEIIAKNGGEVSGRGGSIENKLKALSELSMGGVSGTVYELTEDSLGDLEFYCNPFEVKIGDVLHLTSSGEHYSEETYMQIISRGIGYSLNVEGDRLAQFMYICMSGTTPTLFQTGTAIHVDEDGQPTEPSDHVLVKTGK